MTPTYNGEVLTRTVDKYTHSFVRDDVCAYKITAPEGMQRNDKLMVKIDQIQNTQVYIAKSKDYRWLTHLDKQVVYDNDVFEIAGAYLDFYIVGVSLQIYKGKFRMQTWVEQDAQVVDESYTQPATESDEVVADGQDDGEVNVEG